MVVVSDAVVDSVDASRYAGADSEILQLAAVADAAKHARLHRSMRRGVLASPVESFISPGDTVLLNAL